MILLLRPKVRDCDSLKKMRARYDAGRIGVECGSEIWMAEGGFEMSHRLPNRVVHEDVTLPDGTMKLGGDVTGLLLHLVGIGVPGLEQSRDIRGRDGEEIDKDDGRHVHAELGGGSGRFHPEVLR